MKKQNILFITNKFPPLSCGVGDYTYYLSKEFVKEGYNVTVICHTNAEIAAYWQDSKEKMTVHPVGGKWNKKDWEKVFITIEKLSPDYILFQYVPGGFHHHAIPWALTTFIKKLKKISIKVVTTFHETYVRYNWSHPKYIYLALAQRIIARTVAKNSDALITSIDRYKNQLNKFNKNIKIIPIGSNIPPLPIDKSELLKLRQKIAPNGEFVLTTFGNRDHYSIIDLFLKLLEKKQNVVLLIVGNSDISKNISQNKLREKVIVTGFLEAKEIYHYLKCSDLFINITNFSKKGGSNNKSGALAAGFCAELPIVGSKGIMTNRLLSEKSKIQWLDFDNLNAASDSIQRILDNKELRDLLSHESKLFYNNYLAWFKIYNRYKEFIEYA